jgi:hypothetical protein
LLGMFCEGGEHIMRRSPVLVLIVGLVLVGIGLAYNSLQRIVTVELASIQRTIDPEAKRKEDAEEAKQRAQGEAQRQAQAEAERRAALEERRRAAPREAERERQAKEAQRKAQAEAERRTALKEEEKPRQAASIEPHVVVEAERRAIAEAQRGEEKKARESEVRVEELIQSAGAKKPAAAKGTLLSQQELDARRRANEQLLHDRLTASMRSARYAFNHPEAMYLSRRHQITLTLAADEKTALEELGRQFDKGAEGTVRTGETKYAPVMIATLRGKDFKIEPPDGKEQFVLLAVKGPTEWTWFVEPLETGAGKLLVLQLAARFDRRNEDMPPLTIKTFEARINVDVRVWDSVLIHARRMTPIAQVLTGAGGLIAVIGFIGTTRRWFRRKAGEQPPTGTPVIAEEQEPVETGAPNAKG